MELRIDGFPDYGVNDEGYVFSYKKGKRVQMQAILNGSKNDKRYRVKLYVEGKVKSICVHWLVLNTFHPKPSPELVCRHLNGDRLDNRLCNLQWGTASENNIDCLNHGTHRQRKLSDQDVRDIRAMLSTGNYSQSEIARIYGVGNQGVSKIHRGIRYSHI